MSDYIFLNPAPVSYPTIISMIEGIVETVSTKFQVEYAITDMKLGLDIRFSLPVRYTQRGKLAMLANKT